MLRRDTNSLDQTNAAFEIIVKIGADEAETTEHRNVAKNQPTKKLAEFLIRTRPPPES